MYSFSSRTKTRLESKVANLIHRAGILVMRVRPSRHGRPSKDMAVWHVLATSVNTASYYYFVRLPLPTLVRTISLSSAPLRFAGTGRQPRGAVGTVARPPADRTRRTATSTLGARNNHSRHVSATLDLETTRTHTGLS